MTGHIVAWACFILGLVAGGASWAYMSVRWPNQGRLENVGRVGLSLTVSLAVFSNVSYIAWIAGLPLEMGIVRDDRMAENWWLGPATMLLAVFGWFGNAPRDR